jgi:hypothetical protein
MLALARPVKVGEEAASGAHSESSESNESGAESTLMLADKVRFRVKVRVRVRV